jgi:hypothetical protein
VDGVEAASFFFRQAHRFDCDDAETGLVDASENFTLLICFDGVRLDNCESSFESHLENPPLCLLLAWTRKKQIPRYARNDRFLVRTDRDRIRVERSLIDPKDVVLF